MHFSEKTAEMRKFLSYYSPYKCLFVADMLSSAFVAVLALLLPIIARTITSEVLGSDSPGLVRDILSAGALMLGIIIAQTGSLVFFDYKGHDMGAKIERDMRAELFAHYQRLTYSFFDRRKVGDLMSRLTNDLFNLAELYHHGPENIIVHGTQFIGALFILWQVNWRLTLLVLAMLLPMALYSFYFYHKLRGAYARSSRQIGEVNALAEENLSGVRVVKAFANEKLEMKRFQKENDLFYKNRSNVYKHEAMHFSVVEGFFTPLITVVIIVAGGLWIAEGKLDLANLLLFIMYAAYLTGPVPKLAFMVRQYQEGMAGYRRFREIMDIEPESGEGADDFVIKTGHVEFDNVTFRYDENREYVLKNICLDVQPGQSVAITGQSGAGKTTLCMLISRFYDVDEGEIRIDGVDIRKVKPDVLRRQIGVVGQDTFLFGGTVLDNILYGKPGATQEEAIEAAKKANAHSFIMALPDGYQTEIGQRGITLSGGQRQRLSIARVILKDPPILIFDEATSALDPENERLLMESVKSLSVGRTTFLITHRPGTAQSAGRVLELTAEGITERAPVEFMNVP